MTDLIDGKLICRRCKREAKWLLDGRCGDCNPFMACKKCETGTYKSTSTASWSNRFTCDVCGHKTSK